MRTLAFALCATALCGPAAASSGLTVKVREALAAWSPTEVMHENRALGIALPQRKINHETYRNLIEWLCANSDIGRVDLSEIKEIYVLNASVRQGYVFEGGAKECREIGEGPRRNVNVPLLDRTRLHTNQ